MGSGKANPLVLKLQSGADLSVEDCDLLQRLTTKTRVVEADQQLVAEDMRPGHPQLLLDGFAYSYKRLGDGRRHIIAYTLPGDIIGFNESVLGKTDHAVTTVTRCTVADLPEPALDELISERPALHRAFRWAFLVQQAISREWLVSLGQRSAEEKIAHLLCELLVRFQLVGRASSNSFDLPITQEEIGNTLGLSTVHVNRTIQVLRNAGLVSMQRKRVVVPDFSKLAAFSGFKLNYLHIVKTPD